MLTIAACGPKPQVAEAEEKPRHLENLVRVEIEKETRKLWRTESGLEAARQSVEAREEMRRIAANQLEAKTVTASALKEAEDQLAETQAGSSRRRWNAPLRALNWNGLWDSSTV